MAINIVTSTAGAIYIQTGIGVPTHVAPIGSQFTDTASAKLYRNLDGQTNWQEDISSTGVTQSISAFTTFNTTTPGQSSVIADSFNDSITFSGVNMSILTNEITKTMTFSGSSDGSHLTNIPISGVDGLQSNLDALSGEAISAFTFDQQISEIKITTNNGTMFPIDVTSLAEGIFIVSGEYDPINGSIEFTNNTGGTFVVTGFTTGITDTFVDGGSFNNNTYSIAFSKNIGLGFNLDLSDIQNEIATTATTLVDKINLKANQSDFTGHTSDTSIHFTKSSILLSELGDSAHTHTIAEVNGLQGELDSKVNDTDFNNHVSDFDSHTGDTSIHYTKSSILLSEIGDSAHTHTIAEVNGLQDELDTLASGSASSGLTINFNAHTADTSIHYTKSSISLSELGDSAHTHTIAEVNGLQGTLNTKADEVDFDSHTGDTSIHYTKSSILLSEIGDSAHTHTIAEVNGLQTELDDINTNVSNNFDGIISGVTFNNNILSLNKNDNSSFVTNLSALAKDTLVVSGDYNPNTGNVLFTNNTGGTFNVSGFTTGTTDTFVDSGSFNDTTYNIDFTKNIGPGFSVDLSDINDDITATTLNLQSQIVLKANESSFNTHTGDTSIHYTKSSILFSEIGDSAHTHTIAEVNGLQGELDSKVNDTDFNNHVSDFDSHTGDTSIHYTKSSINLDELGDSAHTHTIAEVNGLQGVLNTKADDVDFDSHTGDTSIHFTKSSILLSEIGDSAHTHTIAEVNDLQNQLNTINTNISNNFDDIISGVTFNSSTNQISFNKNDDASFITDLSALAKDALVVSGEYDPQNSEITFTNNTGGTFVVTGVTTGMTDSFVDSGTINPGSYEVTFTKNLGLGFNLDLSNIQNDIITGDTSLQNQITAHQSDANNPHNTTFSNLLSTAHTHTIADVSGLQTILDSKADEVDLTTKTDEVDFNAHTADTSIHYTKSSILLSEIGDSAHTHTIAEVNGLQGELDSKTDNTDFDTHTGDTSIHYTKSSISLNELGDSAHTHTIAEVNGLQGELDSKLNITGGEITGNLNVTNSITATTYYGDGSNLTGVSNLYVTGMTYDNSNNLTITRNDDTSFNVNITDFSGVTVDGLISGSSISINGGEVMDRIPNSDDYRLLANGASTGVISYNGLSSNINDDSNFDLGPVKGWIVDNTTDPENPTQIYVNFPGSNITNPNGVPLNFLTTHLVSYIGLTGNSVSDIVQSSSPFTEEESRTILNLGVVVHSNNTNINAINNKPKLLIDDTMQTYDLFSALGPFNLGNSNGNNLFTANGSNLSINKSEGRVFSFGSNYITESKNPHIINLPALIAPTIRYRLQDSTEFGNTIFIDPDNYDNGGILTSVPDNKYTVQRINLFVSNIVRLQYGQHVYDNLGDAEASIASEIFVTEQNIKENGLLRGFLIVKKGTNDLTNLTQAKFINASTFGHASETAISNVHRTEILNNGSTGIRKGGLITISGVDTIDISSGNGQIIDNYTDPMNPEFIDAVWEDITGTTISGLSASVFTLIAIDRNQNVKTYPSTNPPTAEDKRDNIFLGAVTHQFGVSLENTVNAPIPITSPINQMEDLANAIGPFSIRGNSITGVPGTLELQKSNGSSFFYGRNFQTNKKSPSILEAPFISGSTLLYAKSDSFVLNTGNTIDMDNYEPDAAGVISPIPNNDFVAHRIWHLPGNNSLVFQYAQASYSTFNIALERFSSENFIIPSGLEEAGYLSAIVIAQEGETDLTASEVRIIPQGKFAGGGGGSGGGGADTLQSAYNNGTNPEIITDVTRNSVDIRAGIGLDSSNLITFQESSGTINGSVDAQGVGTFNGLFASTISGTSVSGDGSGLTNLFIPPLQQNIKVAKSGATFTTIQGAIDSITDASLNKQYFIDVSPGVYIEDITMKPYITIIGGGLSTIVVPTNPSNTIFECSGAFHSSINNLSVSGATASGGTAFNVDTLMVGDGIVLDNITFYSNDKFVNVKSVSGTTATVSIKNSIIPPSSIFTTGFDIGENGVNNVDISSLRGSLNPNNNGVLLKASGPNNLVSFSTVGLVALGAPTAIEVSNGVKLVTQSITLDGFENGLVVTDSGSGPDLNVNDLVLSDINGTAISVQNIDTSGSLGGSWSFNQIDIIEDANISMVFSDPTDDGVAVSVLGDVFQAENTESILNLSKLIRHSSTLGLVSGGTITDVGGLNLDVEGGNGFVFDPNLQQVVEVTWTGETISLIDNAKNFIFINETQTINTAASLPEIGTIIILGLANTVEGNIESIERLAIETEYYGNQVEFYLRAVLGVRYISGSIINAGSGTRTLDISSGAYHFGTTPFRPTGGTDVQFTQYYRNGSGSWTLSNETTVNNTHYDDGSGTLQSLTPGYYAKHALYTVGDGIDEQYMLVLGQQEFSASTTAGGAELGPLPVAPSIFDGSSVTVIGSIIVREGETDIISINDLRPISVAGPQGPVNGGGSGGGVTFHGDLTGLLNDDHTQYLLTNGSREMSGSLNMGGNNITNVGTVDGVDVNLHASRHLPNGLDPLTTGVPSSIGGSNSEGVANAFARQDHIHDHGNQPGGTLHSEATVSTAGFMSASDKAQIGIIYTGGTISGNLTTNNLNTGDVNATNLITTDLTVNGDVTGDLKVNGNIYSDVFSGNSTDAIYYGDGSNLTGVGEVNNGINVGNGNGLFTGKTGSNLQFKSIIAGDNITITPSATTITIESTGGGSSRIENNITTTNAVTTELEKIDTLTDNATNIVEVYIKAYQTATGAQWGVWKRTLTVTKTSGTVTIREINADVDKTSSGLSATSIAFNVNGGDIDLDVTGITSTNIRWDSAYEIIL